MSSRSFNPRLRRWFGLSATVSLMLAVGLYSMMVGTSERLRWVEHSQDVSLELRTLMVRYVEAVIAIRTFASTSDARKLELYRSAMSDVKEGLRKLKVLTAGDAVQLPSVIELESGIVSRADLVDRMIEIKKVEGVEKALQYGKINGLDAYVSQVWASVSKMETQEKQRLRSRVDAVSLASGRSFAFFAAGLTGNLAIIAFAFFYTARQVRQREQAESTLKRSEARFRGTFEAAAVGMGVISLEGRWQEVNSALCAITGYSEKELLTMDFQSISHPDDPSLNLKTAGEFPSGEGQSSYIERRCIHKRGHVVDIAVSASVVRDDNGRREYIVALIDDITARKRAESRLAAQHAVALVLANSQSFEEALPLLMQAVGRSQHFQAGQYWRYTQEPERLVAAERWWSSTRIDREFIEYSKRADFDWGEGLPSRVIAGGRPVVIEDVEKQPDSVRIAAARELSLRGAYGFPVVGSAGPIGVLMFLSKDRAYDDGALRASLFTLGRQIGLFVERRQADDAARSIHSRFRAIFNHTSQFMGLLDTEGTLLEGNKTALDFSGVTREDVVGRPFWDGPWWSSSAEIRGKLRDAIARSAAGEQVRFEADHPGKDGSKLTVDFSLTPVKDEFGRVTLMIPEGHDITTLKRTSEALRESEERFRLLVEGVRDHAIIMLDPTGHVVSWNAAAMAIQGYSSDEIIGAHFSVFYPEEMVITGDPARELEAARNEGRWAGEGRRKRKDGSEFWASIQISPVMDQQGRLRGFANVTRDVTERRQAEEAMVKAKEAAEAANRTKGEFLANMSHEIRTPMNGIIGMTELALETELSSRQRDYLRLVKSSADSLLTVINDILDFSKIEAGKLGLTRAEFLFRDVVEETVQTLAVRGYGKGLEIACRIAPELPEQLYGDSGRLRQIIMNLMGNAIKFTEHGSILLEAEPGVEPASERAVTICFSITDTGVGIANDQLTTIFQPFEQADNSITRRFGGTGLGLAISSKLVELMGGEIWVSSELGMGSVFSFTVTLECSQTCDQANWRSTRQLAAGTRVLVADENAIDRALLIEILNSWGAEATGIGTGGEMIEELSSATASGRPYANMILDMRRPDDEAEPLVKRIRTDADFQGMPLLLMGTDATYRRGLSAPAREFDSWLLKPVKQSDLFTVLSRSTARSAMSRAVTATREQGEATTIPDSGDERRSTGARVLVAEDQPVNQMLIVKHLEKAGYRVSVVDDGRQALEAIEMNEFDVVLMDLRMPVIDGFEAISRIRMMGDEQKRRIPVIALTAHAMQGDRERCLEQGFDGYLSKPVTRKSLRETIDAVLRATPDEMV